jgi:hypothetical protein
VTQQRDDYLQNGAWIAAFALAIASLHPFAGSAPAESGSDVGQNGLHDMHIVSDTQLVRHS